MTVEKPDQPPSPADPAGFAAMVAELRGLIATLQAVVGDLREQLARKDEEVAELKRALLGPKSERHKSKATSRDKPPVSDEEKARRRAAANKKRAARRAERKQQLEVQPVDHPAPAACPACEGQGPFVSLPPDVSREIEYVTERLVRLQHRLEKKKCTCGTIFTAETPMRVTEGGLYGPGLHAYAVVSKCADALPLHRISKRFARGGVTIARSSLTDLFHRTASLLEPLPARLLELVAASDYVNADETSQPVVDEDHCRRGFIWTFIAYGIIAYVFSSSRAGETADRVLGDTTGYLQGAGVVAPTFPDMNGGFLPPGLTWAEVFSSASVNAPLAIHFTHRLIAYALAIVALAWAFQVWRRAATATQRKVGLALAAVVVLQVTLGALTVLQHVAIPLAVAHQGVAFVMLSVLAWVLAELR